MEDYLVVVTPKGYKIPSKDGKMSVHFLMGKNLIMRNPGSGTRKLFESSLTDNNLDINDFNVMAQCENTEAIKRMVASGIGLSVLSYMDIKELIDSNQVDSYTLEEFEMRRNFYFVNHKYKVLSPLSSSFKEFLLKNLGAK